MTAATLRIAIFTHDSYGVGHVRRSSRIMRAIAEKDPKSSLLLITGSPATHLLRELPSNADTIKIPTIVTSGTEGTRPSMLTLGLAELVSIRSELTRCALSNFDPDVFLVDNFPLGTRHELIPSLRELKHRSARTVLGLRDIVDPPEKVRRDWQRDGIYQVIERYYDRVLVYGGAEVLDAARGYALSPTIEARLSYCGYVADEAPSAESAEAIKRELGFDDGFFLATVGGGGDGRPLLEAFLGALDKFPQRPALIVAGEFMSASDRAAITERATAHPHVVVRDYLSNLPAALSAADLVVAMGGYNTSAEIIATGARAVLVPRTWRAGEHGDRGRTGIDAEQRVRSEALARLGMVTVIDTDQLSPESLADAMSRALDKPKLNGNGKLRLDGASCVAEHLLELAAQGSC